MTPQEIVLALADVQFVLAVVGGVYVTVKIVRWLSRCLDHILKGFFKRIALSVVKMISDKLPRTRWNTFFRVYMHPAPGAYEHEDSMPVFPYQTYVEPEVGDLIEVGHTNTFDSYAVKLWAGKHVITEITERSCLVHNENGNVQTVSIKAFMRPAARTKE